MDALKSTNASIYINASHALDINLSLEYARSIDLEGHITRYAHPVPPPGYQLNLALRPNAASTSQTSPPTPL
jgi:hypothetical protein